MTPTRRRAGPRIFPRPSTSCQTVRLSARVGKLRSRLGASFSALQGVFANPDLRRVQFAYAGSSMGNFAYGVAIAVYAYQHGGATAVGVVTAIRQVIAALIAPFAASLADRFPRERVMLGSDLGRLVSVGATAALVVSALAVAHRLRRRDGHDDPRHDLPSGRVRADAAPRAVARGADRGERLVEHVRQPRRLRRPVDRGVPARAQRVRAGAFGVRRRDVRLERATSSSRVHTPAGAEPREGASHDGPRRSGRPASRRSPPSRASAC